MKRAGQGFESQPHGRRRFFKKTLDKLAGGRDTVNVILGEVWVSLAWIKEFQALGGRKNERFGGFFFGHLRLQERGLFLSLAAIGSMDFRLAVRGSAMGLGAFPSRNRESQNKHKERGGAKVSNMLRIKGLGIVRGGVAIALLGVLAMAHPSDDLAPAKEPRPEYAPGVLTVKFKEPVADELKAALVRGEPLHQVPLTPSLDTLNAWYGLHCMRMLFGGFEIKDANGGTVCVESMDEHLARLGAPPLQAEEPSPDGSSKLDPTRFFVLEVDLSLDAEEAAEDYRRDPDVEYADPDYLGEYDWQPNDYFYNHSNSWGQGYDDLWGVKRINCASAWDTSRGSGVTIAVIDTGVWYRFQGNPYYDGHPDLKSNLWFNYYEFYGHDDYDDDGNGYVDDVWGWDFEQGDKTPDDECGHGTHVAGIAAAVGNNTIGVIGVAPFARCMNLKVGTANPVLSAACEAIQYAAENGARVINCSWGFGGMPSALVEAVQYANNIWGCVIVAAAGNGSGSNVRYVCPANLKWTVAVSATNYQDSISYYSNIGSLIDVGAPGGAAVDILSARSWQVSGDFANQDYWVDDPNDPHHGRIYVRSQGTSMAAPHVAGAAAVVRSLRPSFNPEHVRQAIRKGAIDLAPSGFDPCYGHGRLDAYNAIGYAYPCPTLILQPLDGDSFSRGETESVDIYGIAEGYYFQYWELAYSPAVTPLQWTVFGYGYERKYWYYGGYMSSLNIGGLANGAYLIRLRVTNGPQSYYDYILIYVQS